MNFFRVISCTAQGLSPRRTQPPPGPLRGRTLICNYVSMDFWRNPEKWKKQEKI